jgi:hypothetical protein
VEKSFDTIYDAAERKQVNSKEVRTDRKKEQKLTANARGNKLQNV